jgi:hypothetical protein
MTTILTTSGGGTPTLTAAPLHNATVNILGTLRVSAASLYFINFLADHVKYGLQGHWLVWYSIRPQGESR